MRSRVPSLAFLFACLAFAFQLGAAMTSEQAVLVLLNSKGSTTADVFAEAQETAERAAAAGEAFPQFALGVKTDDKALAERYLTAARPAVIARAERQNDPLAWYLLSLETNNMKYLRRAAAGGNVQALNALGTILIQRASNDKTLSTNEVANAVFLGFGCFNRAASKRDPNGFVNLGTCYLRGIGCKTDKQMAVSCFEAAAEAGHPEGMENLADCYRVGDGVEKSVELCLYWEMKARASRGDEAAAKWLKERK